MDKFLNRYFSWKIVVFGFVLIASWYFYKRYPAIANSSFLTASVTLLVGGVAIYIYLKQRRDTKRDAAKLILQEIRYAEGEIRKAREKEGGTYPLAIRLLPTNSWNKNIHLFVDDFNSPELDIISRFYSQVEYIDSIIQAISDQKTNPRREDYENVVKRVLEEVMKNTGQWGDNVARNVVIGIPTPALSILQEVTQRVELIYNTPAAQKFREISERTGLL